MKYLDQFANTYGNALMIKAYGNKESLESCKVGLLLKQVFLVNFSCSMIQQAS